MISRVAITGGAGFIGSHMVDTCLEAGIHVRIVDNFRTGRHEFVPHHQHVELHEGNILNLEALLPAFDGCDWVIHLAANPDARGERRGVNFNLEQNVTGTATVLEAMQHVGTTRILYASSASIYGNTSQTPTPEDFRSVPQASFYGASKLAAEGLIGAYCEMFDFTAVLGRWVHILGEGYLHGHIIDFLRQLRRTPDRLHILGDGHQKKSGLHARNLCDGLLLTMQKHNNAAGTATAYNFGGDTLLPVRDSAELIAEVAGYTPQYTFSGRRNGGWVGDNPSLILDWRKAAQLGWKPTMTVPDAIRLTAEWLLSSECHYL